MYALNILQEVVGEKSCKPIIIGHTILRSKYRAPHSAIGPLTQLLFSLLINLPILFCETICCTSISIVAVEIRVRIQIQG